MGKKGWGRGRADEEDGGNNRKDNARQRENKKKKKVGFLPGVTSYGSNTFQQSSVCV